MESRWRYMVLINMINALKVHKPLNICIINAFCIFNRAFDSTIDTKLHLVVKHWSSLWPGVVEHIKVPSPVQIDLFENYFYLIRI